MVDFETPQGRTSDLFSREVEDLSTRLPGTIVILGNGARLRIDQTEPWFRSDTKVINGQEMRSLKVIGRPGIEKLGLGCIWLCPLKFRKIDQTIIVAQDRGEIGACVRMLRASGNEIGSDNYDILPREGDIAKFLIRNGGLRSNWVGRLRFLVVDDDELSLQVLGPFEEVSLRRLDCDEANIALEGYFREI